MAHWAAGVRQAPLLADLGDHGLPSRVPWKNLQILLRKADARMVEIVKALQGPFGSRLARHVRTDPLSRAEVEEADAGCVPLLDWAMKLLEPLERPRKALDPEVQRLAGLSEAMAEQERRGTGFSRCCGRTVARLRRDLREALRSERAAEAFAEQHRPAERALQYRLSEVEVPATQEAVLQSLVKSLLEGGSLEIVGRSEAWWVSGQGLVRGPGGGGGGAAAGGTCGGVAHGPRGAT